MAKEPSQAKAPPVPIAEQMRWRERERIGLEQGRIIIKGKQTPSELGEQGHIKTLSNTWLYDTASDNMTLFVHDIPKQTGKHVHQGTYSLFVIEGKGYTVVDGVRSDWEAGDLILLPVKAGGVEHQHFNLEKNKHSRWLAIRSRPLVEMIGRRIEQREVSPDWKEEHGEKLVYFEKKIS